MHDRKTNRAERTAANERPPIFDDIHLRDVEGVLSEKAKKKGVEAGIPLRRTQEGRGLR